MQQATPAIVTYSIDILLSIVCTSIIIRKAYKLSGRNPAAAYRMEVLESGGLVALAAYLFFFGNVGGGLFVVLLALILWNESSVKIPDEQSPSQEVIAGAIAKALREVGYVGNTQPLVSRPEPGQSGEPGIGGAHPDVPLDDAPDGSHSPGL